MYNVLGVSSVEGGQATVDAAAQFHPFFPGLIILLPLIGPEHYQDLVFLNSEKVANSTSSVRS